MGTPKRDLADEVRRLAPISPPCFAVRSQWLTYLDSAAQYQRPDHPGPLVLRPGEPAEFNMRFNFCADCTHEHAATMRKADLCVPDWLRKEESKWLKPGALLALKAEFA